MRKSFQHTVNGVIYNFGENWLNFCKCSWELFGATASYISACLNQEKEMSIEEKKCL